MKEEADKPNPKLFLLTLLSITLVAGFFWLSLQHFPSVGTKIFFCLFGTIFFILGVIGISTGSVPTQWWSIEQTKRPICFWMIVVGQFLTGAFVIGLGWSEQNGCQQNGER